VHGAVGEQGEDGGANVTAASPWPTSAASTARSEAGTEIEATAAGELLVAMAPRMARMAM
jgi:hypothetical protein